MSDMWTIAAFVGMVLAPCVVASHAAVQEDGPSLGYMRSMRRMRGRLIERLRV